MPGKPGFLFLGSFNGILLLHTGNILCLWNPSIRVYQQISRPKLSKFPDAKILYGLGYDSISDDFKVVSAIRPQWYDPCIVHVFSSKLNSWKRWTADFNYDIIWRNGSGTVLNGAPHWVWYRSDRNTLFPSNQESVIVCFDATEEKFKEVPNPNYEGEDTPIHLGVLGGCLCVVEEHRKRLDSYADFWVMKEYGTKDSWTKLFVVQSVPGEFFFQYLKLLCDSEDGELFIRRVLFHPVAAMGLEGFRNQMEMEEKLKCGDGTIDVWVMKEYSIKESWTKLFVVPNGLCGLLMPLCYANDGEVVVVLDWEELGIHYPKRNRYMWIGIPPDSGLFDVAFYVDSCFT
ncbi:hypothetical protein RHMOL_Rhmol04G0343400 [Rhododendron molle]|uniref:Uncharacterized protein n=1 Tax=Rhododendron molle TaxID=49168 RepID=A0ACC0P8J5_RHOML|nr:hypothetical protein RHMOL_Rhmol04G0343400 [Rhododendron molle]